MIKVSDIKIKRWEKGIFSCNNESKYLPNYVHYLVNLNVSSKSDHIIDKRDTIMVIGDKDKLDKFASEQTS